MRRNAQFCRDGALNFVFGALNFVFGALNFVFGALNFVSEAHNIPFSPQKVLLVPEARGTTF